MRTRQSAQTKIQTIASFRKVAPKSIQVKTAKDLVVDISKRYTRETKSMLKLKNNLEEIESVIKQIKMATLCSHAKEIFPRCVHKLHVFSDYFYTSLYITNSLIFRIKSQIESNFKLIKENDIGQMHHEFLNFKEKVAEEQQHVLLHNFSKEEEQ